MKTLTLSLLSLLLASTPRAQQPPRANATAMPVRALTAFKDGHAYVVRDVALPSDGDGEVVLDQLPSPVLGTFWPFATGGAELRAAKAGSEEVPTTRRASTLAELAKANVGRKVELQLDADATVVGTLTRVAPAEGVPSLVVVEDRQGMHAVATERLRGLRVLDGFSDEVPSTQRRQRLQLRVAGGGRDARVGVAYVQRGFRWIPSYRIDLDGNGAAQVRLQATLVNDLVDLDGATVNLVVGVPKFAFAGTVDPVSLQQQVAEVAQAQRMYAFDNGLGNMLSNSIMTQVPGGGGGRAPAGAPADPSVGAGESNEDLFVFPVEDVTLKRGERLVVPVASFTLSYRDVYRYEVALAPPLEYQRNLKDNRVFELARQLAAAKVRHVLRLDNDSDMPLTTAPALVLQQGRVLAQGQMRYASRGQQADLEINVAVDVRVDSEEREVERTPNVRRNGDDYTRVDMAGRITLTNSKTAPVEVEVTRRVLGLVDEVSRNGDKRQLDLVGAWGDGPRPAWWSWWSWPHWWFRQNGFGECRWTVELEPGEQAQLDAAWHYFWR